MQSNRNRNTTPQHQRTNFNTRIWSKYRINKDNYHWKKDHITITQIPKLENSKDRNWKITKILKKNIPTNNINELNKLIYAGAKLVCDKNGIPLRNTNRNSKAGWEIRLNTHKDITTCKDAKKKKKLVNTTRTKTASTLNSTKWGDKSQSICKRMNS